MPLEDFLKHFSMVTACDPRIDQLPTNRQIAGNIGAACADQAFTIKRCVVDSWRFICCCAGIIEFWPYPMECIAGCGPCFKPCWARQGVYTLVKE